MDGLQFHFVGYEVRANRSIAYPNRYQVEWVGAKKRGKRDYTYLTRAETFAAKKMGLGYQVALWDRLELKCLKF